jgi:hypothetical protein
MAHDPGYQYGTQRKRKRWRYPGAPIPWRLRDRYE